MVVALARVVLAGTFLAALPAVTLAATADVSVAQSVTGSATSETTTSTKVEVNGEVLVDETTTTADGEPTETTLDLLVGVDDDDLTVDLEAETLPTTNPVRYFFERLRSNVLVALTFNTERKAAHFETLLHQLDRKLAACAEVGDEECVTRVETHQAALKERATHFFARREELKDEHLERLEAWREKREALVEERRERAAELKEKREELREQFKERQGEIREQREEQLEEMKAKREERQAELKAAAEERSEQREERREAVQEQRTERLQKLEDQRAENRERLIEQRSERLKSTLDATRAQVNTRQERFDTGIQE